MQQESGKKLVVVGEQKPPKFVWEGKPKGMSAKEESIWWGNEQEKWVEGSDGLRGLHYFYLTQIKIKQPRGALIHPWWRDVDEEIIEEWYEARREGKDLCIYKRRGIGLSALFGAGVSLWTALTSPGSTSLLTSNNDPKTKKLYNEKVSVAISALDPWIKPEKVSNQMSGYWTGNIKDTEGMITGNLSNILARQTSENVKAASAFESERAAHAFIDELFLHDYASEVRQSIQACLMDDLEKIAPVVFGGSAGIVSQQGIKEAELMWRDADVMGVRTVFIPGTKGVSRAPEIDENGKETGIVYDFCFNGHSNEQAAREWILRKREVLDKAKDKRPYIGFVKSYPLSVDDIFDLNAVGIIPEDILPKINAKKKEIRKDPKPIHRYNILTRNGVPYAEADSKGDFFLLEHPVPGEKYYMGTDPIPFVDDEIDTKKALDSKERSVHASIVKRASTNQYIGFYLKRTNDPSTIFHECTLMQRYYNGCGNMVERNQGRVLMREYKTNGANHLLANQPKVMGKKSFDMKEVKGYHKDKWNRDTLYDYFFEYLRHHCDKIEFLEILESLPDFHIKNTDLLDAMVGCELYHMDELTRSEKKYAATQTQQVSSIVYKDGKRIEEWTEIPIFDGESNNNVPHIGFGLGKGSLWQTR